MQRYILALGLVLGVLAGACVNIPDPDHCWNLERDRTCRKFGPDVVCSPCLRGYQGCVDAELAPDCDADDAGGSSSSSEGP